MSRPWEESRDRYIAELGELTGWKDRTRGLIVASNIVIEPAEYQSPEYEAILEEKAEIAKRGMMASMRTLAAERIEAEAAAALAAKQAEAEKDEKT